MDSAATLVLFALIVSFVGDAAASCRKVANEEMVEYVCEGGHPADLTAVPETTEKLRITRMPLRRITTDTFSRFGGNLWVLSCSHCEITDIDADAFRRLVNLQQLNLDSNRLTTVKASWFEGLEYLTYLDLSYNDIRDIEDGVYRNLPGLVDLRVSGNRLRCLNLDEMTHLRELKRMYLSENSDFACPHAVSKFLENQGVTFEQDPEWRRLASDTIDVDVPPSSAEEDKEIVPAHRERLHPDRKPPPEDRDRAFYPVHTEHRSRHRRPPTTTVRPKQRQEEPLPRVEPRFPDARTSHVPSETSNSIPQTPPESPLEDMKISSGSNGPSRTEYTLTYPYSTRETTPYWSYSTPERSRSPSVPTAPLPEDRVAGTERTLTYPPPYIPTHETTLHPTSVGSRVPGSEGETGRESERLSQGNTVTYPLYVTTSDGLERLPHGSVPSLNVSEMIMWATDDSLERPTDPSWVQERHEQERHEQSRPAGENDGATWSTRTPYYGHDPREMIVEDSSSRRKIDEDDLATDRPVRYDPSRITTASTMHYVRPSPPELMHSPSTDEFYQAPYYEPTVTVHSPILQNYQNGHGTGVRPIDPTTEQPDCPEKNSTAPKTQSVAALMTFAVAAVLGRAVAGRF